MPAVNPSCWLIPIGCINMSMLVHYPPTKSQQHSNVKKMLYGIIPARVVVVRRMYDWCVYGWPKYLSPEYAAAYGTHVEFVYVKTAGYKLLEDDARKLFPEMSGPYAY